MFSRNQCLHENTKQVDGKYQCQRCLAVLSEMPGGNPDPFIGYVDQSWMNQDPPKRMNVYKNFNEKPIRNFDRNFSNTFIPEKEDSYEYYVDRKMQNTLVINRSKALMSIPVKYQAVWNNKETSYTDREILGIITDYGLTRVNDIDFQSIMHLKNRKG